MGVVVKESLSLVALWSYNSGLVFSEVIMPLNGTKKKATTKSTSYMVNKIAEKTRKNKALYSSGHSWFC